jgi:hypothetical protein
MSIFSELTPREKSIEIVRWVCVVPAAALGSLAVQYVLGSIVRMAASGGGDAARSGFVHYLHLLLYYAPMEAAFVIVGARVAPCGRVVTAIVLAVGAIVISLLTHILAQQVVGGTNYTHFALESIGAILGAAFILYLERTRNRMGGGV